MKTLMIFVAGLLVHFASAALDCEKTRMKTCAHEYKLAVRDNQPHCERLQIMINCLAQDSSCDDIAITSFRFWMLQIGLMDKIMGNCTDLATDNLRSLTTRISDKRPDLFADSVEFDTSPSLCATTIHNKCVEHYVNTLRQSRQICTAVQALNDCYNQRIVQYNCEADIIKHFANVVKEVAPRVINVLQTYLPQVCNNWP